MYHDCNTDFEKIRKRIEEEKNKCRKCYIQGPTGPKGEIGPTGPRGEKFFSNVNVGETKTGEANTNAMVENVGTNKNAILNFTIPKGDKGDIGPQGLVGTIILDSYASLYEDNGNSYMLVANTPNQVEFSKKFINKNMDISFTNMVKVLNEGIYKIDYFFSSVASAQSDISIELRKENITKNVNNQEYVWFNGSIIVSLNKDEKLDLAVSSTTNVTLTPDEDTVSYLNMIKIG